jgi:hypothetical protein
MAGVASDDRQVQSRQPNPTLDQRLALHPPTLLHNPGLEVYFMPIERSEADHGDFKEGFADGEDVPN